MRGGKRCGAEEQRGNLRLDIEACRSSRRVGSFGRAEASGAANDHIDDQRRIDDKAGHRGIARDGKWRGRRIGLRNDLGHTSAGGGDCDRDCDRQGRQGEKTMIHVILLGREHVPERNKTVQKPL